MIRSQTSGDLEKRGKGHTENSEGVKRLEVHPCAQCTQRMMAGRALKGSGEPLVVPGAEAMKSERHWDGLGYERRRPGRAKSAGEGRDGLVW